ncbi:hypothetical protein [Neisseria yangbaofengii]|nr:hypothetical protein [Neisseria yangbaofengii]
MGKAGVIRSGDIQVMSA